MRFLPSGYSAWLDRPPSQRALDPALLTKRIRAIHAVSNGICGSPNIHAEWVAKAGTARQASFGARTHITDTLRQESSSPQITRDRAPNQGNPGDRLRPKR